MMNGLMVVFSWKDLDHSKIMKTCSADFATLDQFLWKSNDLIGHVSMTDIAKTAGPGKIRFLR